MNKIFFLYIYIIICSACATSPSYQDTYRPNTIAVKKSYSNYVGKMPQAKGRTPISFYWPINGKIVNKFGENVNSVLNKGVNVRGDLNQFVKAAADGRIVFASYLKGWGETLIIEHPYSFYTVYANLANLSVKEGFLVKQGDSLGKVVAGGSKTNQILHFEIRKRYVPQDPLMYLK